MKIDMTDKKTVGIIVAVILSIIFILCGVLWNMAFGESPEDDIEVYESDNLSDVTEENIEDGLIIEVEEDSLDSEEDSSDAEEESSDVEEDSSDAEEESSDVEEDSSDAEEESSDSEEDSVESEQYVEAVPDLKVLSGETSESTRGIDVSQYQGNIDWDAVANTGVEFAMIRVGIRSSTTGAISEDSCARYNLQEATANGIQVGAYFFSTAITEAEILEEVDFLCDILDGYSVTYPVVFDCEGYGNNSSRQYDMTAEERTDLAMLFLEEVENRGYVGMFYGATSDLTSESGWDTSDIELEYRVWVAQYSGDTDVALTEQPTYSGDYAMWQYSAAGSIAGIDGDVDMNIAYFGCSAGGTSIDPDGATDVEADIEVGVTFEEVSEEVTAKELVNIRSSMDQGDDSNVIGSIENGTVVVRTGIGNNGWSRITYDGQNAYVVSQYITTDLDYKVEVEEESAFNTQFTDVYEEVTAKDVTNLRDIPSVDEPSQVIAELTNGTVAIRTGTSNEGWSRVEYDGQVLYCISSYLEVIE